MINNYIRLLCDIAKMYGWITISEDDGLFYDPGKYAFWRWILCQFFKLFLDEIDELWVELMVLVSLILVAISPIIILLFCLHKYRHWSIVFLIRNTISE